MRMLHRSIICLCLAAVVAAAPAQQVPDNREASQTPDVLGQLPTDALGFLMVSDLQGMSDHINEFLGALQLPFPMPPGGMLSSVKAMFGLGPGFDPSGGMAIVMLDPEPFGVELDFNVPGLADDTIVVIDEETGELREVDEPEDDGSNVWPVIFFVPGDGVQGVFGNFPSTQVGDYTQLEMPMATVFATYRDGYVLVSPRADALAALLAQSGRLAEDLSEAQRAELTEPDLAVHMDAATASPLAEQMFEKMFEVYQTMLQANEVESVETQMAGYRMGQEALLGLLEQTQTGTMTLSLNDEGIHIGGAMAMDPESDLGAALASLELGPSPTPNRVPDLPYAVAIAMNVDYTDQIAAVMNDLEATALAALPESYSVPADQLAEMRTIRTELGQQITGVQYVVGADPDGQMRIAAVMECVDSAEVMALIRRGADSELAMLEGLQANDDLADDIAQIEMTYEADAYAIDGVSVDTLHLTYPVAAEGPDPFAEMMMQFFGDGELNAMMGAPDAQTVVATFGDPYLFTAALATCDGTGPIPANPDVAQAMAVIPGDACIVGLINLKNAMQFSTAVAEDLAETAPMGMGMMMMEGNVLQYMETEVPLVFYMQAEESTLRGTLFMPIETLRDAMQSSMRYMMEQIQQQMESGEHVPGQSPRNGGGF